MQATLNLASGGWFAETPFAGIKGSAGIPLYPSVHLGLGLRDYTPIRLCWTRCEQVFATLGNPLRLVRFKDGHSALSAPDRNTECTLPVVSSRRGPRAGA